MNWSMATMNEHTEVKDEVQTVDGNDGNVGHGAMDGDVATQRGANAN
jgi:hypothetical protein